MTGPERAAEAVILVVAVVVGLAVVSLLVAGMDALGDALFALLTR